MFHSDEYIGLPETHPVSFRRFLKGRFVNKVYPGNVYLIKGDAKNPELERKLLGKIINQKEINVSFVGIGENGIWLLTILLLIFILKTFIFC